MPLTLEEYGCVRDFSVLYSGGLDFCAVPLVVGAKNVDDSVEPALEELVVVVGNVPGEVGWISVAPDDDFVLVVAQRR